MPGSGWALPRPLSWRGGQSTRRGARRPQKSRASLSYSIRTENSAGSGTTTRKVSRSCDALRLCIGFKMRKQQGLRIGVLLVDGDVLLWAPTPQYVEAAPTEPEQPNGLRLGRDPVASLEKAIAPEGLGRCRRAGK